MSGHKRTVLITGCSDGGTGAALAKELHARGLHVYATARNVDKMQSLANIDGIELLPLEITSQASVQQCLKKIPRLDILVNNAGAQYAMPVSDLDITEAKRLFDANVWGHIAVTQAFLPLLLRSPKGMVVNHTSVGAGSPIPFQATYNASKAAMAMFSDTLRMELQVFGIKVVQLRTGGVKTQIVSNVQAKKFVVPERSIWAPAREIVNKLLRQEWAEKFGILPEQWAKQVVGDVLRENPPKMVWRGEMAFVSKVLGLVMPSAWLEWLMKRAMGFQEVEKNMRKEGRVKVE